MLFILPLLPRKQTVDIAYNFHKRCQSALSIGTPLTAECWALERSADH